MTKPGMLNLTSVTGFVSMVVYAMVLFIVMGIIGIFSGMFMLMMVFVVIIFIVILLIIVTIRQPSGKKWIIASASIVMILIFVALFTGWFGKFTVLPPPGWNEHGNRPWSTQFIETGAGRVEVRGAWAGPPGSDQGAFLDAFDYRSSFRVGGAGEKITMVATACSHPDWRANLDAFSEARYKLYWSDGGDWKLIKEFPVQPPMVGFECGKGASPFPTVQWSTGDKPGWIGVNVEVVPHFSGESSGWVFAGGQIAQVFDGTAAITSPPRSYLAKIGENVAITFRLGNACSSSSDPLSAARSFAEGGGWSALVYSKAQGKNVATWGTADLGCGGTDTPQYKTVHYTVVSEDFSKTGAVCDQELRIELYNNLYMVTDSIVYTLDISKAFELPKPSLSASSSSIELGQAVTITANSSVVGTEFVWNAYYVNGELFATENNTNGVWTIQPPRIGDIDVTVNCRKTDDCSMSQPATIRVNVRPVGTGPPLVDPNWVPWIIFFLALIVLWVLVIIFVPKPLLKLAIGLIGTLVLVLIAVWMRLI